MSNLEARSSKPLSIPEETHHNGLRILDRPTIDSTTLYDLESVYRLPSADAPAPSIPEALQVKESLVKKAMKLGRSVIGIFRHSSTPTRETQEAASSTSPSEMPTLAITDEVATTGVIGSNLGPVHGPGEYSPSMDISEGRSIGEDEKIPGSTDPDEHITQARTTGIIK